jgi:flagellar FliL protein
MAGEPLEDEESETEPAAKAPKPKSSIISTIAAVAALTALGAAAGGLIGMQLFTMVEVAAKKRAEAKDDKAAPEYSGDLTVKPLPPITTNVANSPGIMLRLEASVIFDGEAPRDADALAVQISGDSLAFLRTVSLHQIEGASGLLHLREDLTERARTRSEGRVREFIIQALAIE